MTLAPVIEVSNEPLPDTFVNTPFVATILPTLALPVALNVVANTPVVNVLPDLVLAKEVNVTTSFVIETFEPNAISALLTSQPMNAIFAAPS